MSESYDVTIYNLDEDFVVKDFEAKLAEARKTRS